MFELNFDEIVRKSVDTTKRVVDKIGTIVSDIDISDKAKNKISQLSDTTNKAYDSIRILVEKREYLWNIKF